MALITNTKKPGLGGPNLNKKIHKNNYPLLNITDTAGHNWIPMKPP